MSAVFDKYRSINRLDKQRELERDLASFQPDTVAALELLHAWYRGVEDRFGSVRCADLKACVDEVEEALAEIEE